MSQVVWGVIIANGVKVFVGYSGDKPQIVDPTTGETQEVELLSAPILAASKVAAPAREQMAEEAPR